MTEAIHCCSEATACTITRAAVFSVDSYAQYIIHTADSDATKLFCRVALVSAVCIGLRHASPSGYQCDKSGSHFLSTQVAQKRVWTARDKCNARPIAMANGTDKHCKQFI